MNEVFPGGIFAGENENGLQLGNEFLTLFFSKRNGQLSAVAAPDGNPVFGKPDEMFQSVKIASGGKLNSYPPKFKHFYSLEPENMDESGGATVFRGWFSTRLPCGVEFIVVCEDPDWRIEQILEFEVRQPYVRIDWKITNRKNTEERLRALTFQLPELTFEKPLISLPGAISVPDSEPEKMPPLTYCKFGAFARNENDTFCAAAWTTDTDFMNLNRCSQKDGRVFFSQEHRCSGDLGKGDAIHFGSDYILLSGGSLNNAIESFRGHYRDKGLTDSTPRSPVARDAVIFEANVGAILFDPDFSYCPYPTLADFRSDLPRLRSLGFNTIQLMPKMPFPWYTVTQYDDFHGTYGGESDEELKEFIRNAHELGFRFLFDIVLHGAADAQSSRKGIERYQVRNRLFAAGLASGEVNPYRREHPDWFRYDENGGISFIHTWSLDFDSPELAKLFTDHLKQCVSEYGCDGFRFDAPYWGCEPNWRKGYPLFPGASFSRNVKLLRDAKNELLRFKPGLLWYTEHEHAEWRAFMDMTYTYEESWLLWRPAPGQKLPIYQGVIDAAKMARWFDLRRRVLPRSDIVLQHHIDSHDSWWNEADSAFARDKFGRAAARLLNVFCMFIDGAFLGYAGTEKGDEDFFRKMLAIRRENPVFTLGSCDYLKIGSGHPRVLAFFRKYREVESVLLFNFSEETSLCRIHGAECLSGTVLRDLVDGTAHRLADELKLEPNGLMILSAEK